MRCLIHPRPLSLVAAGLLGICDTALADNSGRPEPTVDPSVIVVAHRGGAAYAPENTMLAFANAVRRGSIRSRRTRGSRRTASWSWSTTTVSPAPRTARAR